MEQRFIEDPFGHAVFLACFPQLVAYEFAVIGMWGFGGTISKYLDYTGEASTAQFFNSFSSAVLSMYQVRGRQA